jgi:hypothetical protein
MAGEAVHVFLRGEIVLSEFLPAVADMAGHASFLVALRADAEVVDLVGFADGDGFVAPGDVEFLSIPTSSGWSP